MAVRAIYTLYISSNPSLTLIINPYKERRERENNRKQKGSEHHAWAHKKALTLLLKPASPTPLIRASARLLNI